MRPNYTCESCWCIVLEKFRTKHNAWHRSRGEEDGGNRRVRSANLAAHSGSGTQRARAALASAGGFPVSEPDG